MCPFMGTAHLCDSLLWVSKVKKLVLFSQVIHSQAGQGLNRLAVKCMILFVCLCIFRLLLCVLCWNLDNLLMTDDISNSMSKRATKVQEIKFAHFSIFKSCTSTMGSHREVYRDFQTSLTSSAGGAKGWSEHRFRVPPAYTAQLLTLHQHRANNQYRTANQIESILRVSSSTQATLERSLASKYEPTSKLLDFSDCTRTGIFKLISRCALCFALTCSNIKIWTVILRSFAH